VREPRGAAPLLLAFLFAWCLMGIGWLVIVDSLSSRKHITGDEFMCLLEHMERTTWLKTFYYLSILTQIFS